jgi:hypothetical protein
MESVATVAVAAHAAQTNPFSRQKNSIEQTEIPRQRTERAAKSCMNLSITLELENT